MIRRFFSTVIIKPPISITSNAWNKINDIINKSKSSGMLFSASSGGCNGFNYNLEIFDDSNSDILQDKIKPTMLENNSNKVYIDPMSEMFLFGTTIDFINEDYKKGIFESRFIYQADRDIATSCGCGVSFSPK